MFFRHVFQKLFIPHITQRTIRPACFLGFTCVSYKIACKVFLLILGCNVSIKADDENNFEALFFQDEHMINNLHSYPELLFLDATYKLTELRLCSVVVVRLPVYLFLVEDSVGDSEVQSWTLISRRFRNVAEKCFSANVPKVLIFGLLIRTGTINDFSC